MTVLSEAEEAAHTASIRVVCGPLDEVSAIAARAIGKPAELGARRVHFVCPIRPTFKSVEGGYLQTS